jgi:predicted small lipoprotein YifL
MKKVILALVIATVTLTSCGSGEPTEAPKTDSTAVVVVDTNSVKTVDTASVSVKDSACCETSKEVK